MMKRALLNIDYIYDFVAEDGKLTCSLPGQALEDYIVSLTKEFIEACDYVVFPIDAHEENDPYHPETKLFPPHNIVGTSEIKLYGKRQDLYENHKDQGNVYYYAMSRYS